MIDRMAVCVDECWRTKKQMARAILLREDGKDPQPKRTQGRTMGEKKKVFGTYARKEKRTVRQREALTSMTAS